MSTEQSPPLPDFPAPQQPPAWDTLPLDEALAELQKYLQTAVLVELHTIPLYLYTAYSMKNKKSSGKIISMSTFIFVWRLLINTIRCGKAGDASSRSEWEYSLFYRRHTTFVWTDTKHARQVVHTKIPLPFVL